jgi:pantothenate kinase type III
LLTIDVGNTNTVLGIFEQDQLIKSWRVKTDPRTTADELWLQYSALVERLFTYWTRYLLYSSSDAARTSHHD